MPTYQIFDTGGSRSFAPGHSFLESSMTQSGAEVAVIIGSEIQTGLAAVRSENFLAILVELGTECLGLYASEDFGNEGSQIIGFSRYRVGASAATGLIELVIQPHTSEGAKTIAAALFAKAGFSTAVCRDAPGRIVDRLIRPHFNRALDALDEGLASAEGLDKALRMGLGHRKGPIELLRETGLAEHFEITSKLFFNLGEPGYRPARRAQVAVQRSFSEDASEDAK